MIASGRGFQEKKSQASIESKQYNSVPLSSFLSLYTSALRNSPFPEKRKTNYKYTIMSSKKRNKANMNFNLLFYE